MGRGTTAVENVVHTRHEAVSLGHGLLMGRLAVDREHRDKVIPIQNRAGNETGKPEFRAGNLLYGRPMAVEEHGDGRGF